MPDVRMSLNEAQKYLKALAAINNPATIATMATASVALTRQLTAQYDAAAIVGMAVSRAEEIAQKSKEHLDLVGDIIHLKESLFQANQRTGVSARLADKKIAQYNLKIQEARLTAIRAARDTVTDPTNVDDVYLAAIVSAQDGAYRPAELQVAIYDEHALDAVVKAIRRQIREIEREITRLNAEIITVQLSEYTIGLLGL